MPTIRRPSEKSSTKWAFRPDKQAKKMGNALPVATDPENRTASVSRLSPRSSTHVDKSDIIIVTLEPTPSRRRLTLLDRHVARRRLLREPDNSMTMTQNAGARDLLNGGGRKIRDLYWDSASQGG